MADIHPDKNHWLICGTHRSGPMRGQQAHCSLYTDTKDGRFIYREAEAANPWMTVESFKLVRHAESAA